MAENPLSVATSGALFGAALTASGVWVPQIIVSQMEFKHFYMLKAFMTASAGSSLFLYIFRKNGWLRAKPRPQSNLGWLCIYDGNIIGGALVGAGMTLTGACPGTVLVQVVTGVPSGQLVFMGGIAGGIIYTAISKYLKTQAAKEAKCDTCLTVPEKLQVSPVTCLAAFEGMCVAMVAASALLAPEQSATLHPILGGLYIGLAQLASLALTSIPVGVSTAYEEVGNWFWAGLNSLYPHPKETRQLLSSRAIVFASGLMAGSWVLARLLPEVIIHAESMPISPMRAVIGGATMLLGARIAGGCPSGHGITGMSMFCLSSLVSVASMFAGGMALAQLL